MEGAQEGADWVVGLVVDDSLEGAWMGGVTGAATISVSEGGSKHSTASK